jgi:DNA-directed RNA polymerase II subunit RPB1
MSVLKVEYPDTMDETKTRVKIGGLLDPRLGTIGRLKISMLVLIHL